MITTIESLKEGHSSIQKKISEMYAEVMYLLYADGDDIKFDDLDHSVPGMKGELPALGMGSIFTTRRSYDNLEFLAEFSPGAVLKKHMHSDCEEIMTCLKGSFIVVCTYENGDVKKFRLNVGDELIINRNVWHQTVSEGVGELDIIFEK